MVGFFLAHHSLEIVCKTEIKFWRRVGPWVEFSLSYPAGAGGVEILVGRRRPPELNILAILNICFTNSLLILWVRVNTSSLHSRLKFNPNLLLTFGMIFAAPLQSALIDTLFVVGYKPRFVLFPDGFQSLSFSPQFRSSSPSKKEAWLL